MRFGRNELRGLNYRSKSIGDWDMRFGRNA